MRQGIQNTEISEQTAKFTLFITFASVRFEHMGGICFAWPL